MLAVLALATACVVLAELWRLEVSFEYRRSLVYAGLAMTMLVGAASSRLGRGPVWALGAVVVVAYVGHVTVGLRLPERLLSGSEPKGTAALTIRSFGESLARGDVEDASAVVTDSCHTFVVPYLVRRPTLVAFAPWQVGFKSRVPLAARATAILHGGPEGRRVARSLGVGYVVANPSCTPDLPRASRGLCRGRDSQRDHRRPHLTGDALPLRGHSRRVRTSASRASPTTAGCHRRA